MDIQELKKIFKAKTKKELVRKEKLIIKAGFEKISFEEFEKWLIINDFKKGCYYCKTTNERSFELYNKRYYATRGGKRGKRLELDRKDPLKPYDDLENLVWCCYWCNNAKSNFFSEEEFKPVAEAIGKAIKNLQL